MKGVSYRKLIDLKCKDCIYDEYGEGNWRQQTGHCTVISCPLYPVRPKSSGNSEKRQNIAIKEG